MALKLPSFRTRSPERDRQSDLLRQANVQAPLEDAIAGIRREMEGLERRTSDTLQRAAWQAASSGDYGEREAADEHGISDLERQAQAGYRRIATLRLHLKRYEQMLELLNVDAQSVEGPREPPSEAEGQQSAR